LWLYRKNYKETHKKEKFAMRNIALSLATALILLCSFTANAVLNMGGKTIFTGTLIEVLEPGSATQIQDIIDNIADASAIKPYLIHLGPGEYDLGANQIVMKEWVSIQGSGQEATKITGEVGTGAYDSTSAVVVGVNNAALTDLTIENTGGTAASIGIFNNNASPRIERVAVTVSGGGGNYGLWNQSSSSPTMNNVTASASGGEVSVGVDNISSSPVMENVTAKGLNSSNTCYGVLNQTTSTPTMNNVTASASGCPTSYGVQNFASSPTMNNVTATASGGTSHGVFNTDTSSPFIQNSMLEGGSAGLIIGSPDTKVVYSKIIGGRFDEPSGATNCLGNYDENLDPVDC
jgi:hypothetical protein